MSATIHPLFGGRPDPEQLSSDRLSIFLAGGAPDHAVGPIAIDASSLGSPDDWARSAIGYLNCALNGTQGGALGGAVEVSAAAIGTLLGYVERLEIAGGIIPAPGDLT